MVLILLAYALNVFGALSAQDISYLLLNIVGSVFIIFHAFYRRDFQPAILNIIWALVALINVLRLF